MRFEAVIFDCDGVLVDSETLENQVFVECAADLGLNLTVAEAVAMYKGRKLAECIADVEERLGRGVPDSFVPDFRARSAKVFQNRLQPVLGVEAVIQAVQALSVPFCVASSGPREKIEANLSTTGLLSYFEESIVSAYEVGSWKPDPGLFLHAARMLGVAPKTCAVIEDSQPGVQAGVAAGMTVFGYARDTEAEALAAAGAQVFQDMAQLPVLLQEN
ncbi:MAG: HAD-IA family hydrolase [Desulfurellaceae bacterium]|nr:HAD-IA family hydrolase [Desulfurellaceae bacterium]